MSDFRGEEHRVTYYQYFAVSEMTKPQVLEDERHCTEAIRQCKEMIEWLENHRLELSERFQTLETTASHIRVTLKRENRYYQHKVFYQMMWHRVYEDGTEEKLDHRTYPGAERAQALRDFKAMQEEKPHQEYVLDIEKAHWEN